MNENVTTRFTSCVSEHQNSRRPLSVLRTYYIKTFPTPKVQAQLSSDRPSSETGRKELMSLVRPKQDVTCCRNRIFLFIFYRNLSSIVHIFLHCDRATSAVLLQRGGETKNGFSQLKKNFSKQVSEILGTVYTRV